MSEVPNVILELIGGSEDGAVWQGEHMRAYYWQADSGRVGARFRVIPDYTFRCELQKPDNDTYPFKDHHFEVYEVIERREEWDHVYVRANYLGRESSVPIENPDIPEIPE